MRVLVTGGNRYIGLNLVFELARQGHDVTVVNSHEAPLPEGARRIHADRTVPGTLDAVLGPVRDDFDAVFDNTAYTLDDVRPMVELFRDRVQHYVFTSSSAVYRRTYVQPVHEGTRRHDPADDDPRKAYGVGKVRCEDYLRQEFERTGFPATSLRVGHTLGPRSPLVTRDPIFFARLEQGRPLFLPGDGFAFVSLVHVADVARFMAALLGNEVVKGEAYNVVGTEVASILGVVQVMARVVGVTPHIVHVPQEEARHLGRPLVHWNEGTHGGVVISNEKGRRDVDWVPRFGIEDGYRDSYEWFRTEGRDRYEYDFSGDEEILERVRG